MTMHDKHVKLMEAAAAVLKHVADDLEGDAKLKGDVNQAVRVLEEVIIKARTEVATKPVPQKAPELPQHKHDKHDKHQKHDGRK
jgi:hypothetical protein